MAGQNVVLGQHEGVHYRVELNLVAKEWIMKNINGDCVPSSTVHILSSG